MAVRTDRRDAATPLRGHCHKARRRHVRAVLTLSRDATRARSESISCGLGVAIISRAHVRVSLRSLVPVTS